MAMLTPQQELNIHSGETWVKGAERLYGGQLPGLGAVIEYGPQQHHGVDTLMHVGEYVELGDLKEKLWDPLWSPLARRAAALGMLYHGYKRTNSLGWAALYAALGFIAPPVAGTVALVQHKRGKIFSRRF
jgi:hypothetical protein